MTETVHEQFADREQQRAAGVLGLWVFLAGEVLLFGGMLAVFAVYRYRFAESFAEAAGHMHIWLASFNTVLLLTSGLTMAFADRAAQLSAQRSTQRLLLLTLALGTAFLVIKSGEWVMEYQEGLVPFLDGYSYRGAQAANASLFFNFYFVMTGIHALHMFIGLVMIAVMAWQWRGNGRDLSTGRSTGDLGRQLRLGAIYWGFVDVVWVFVYTSLYLLT